MSERKLRLIPVFDAGIVNVMMMWNFRDGACATAAGEPLVPGRSGSAAARTYRQSCRVTFPWL